ncbi:Voltage-dependent anion channel [Caldanaerovirga acetigignens]|uniref:Voltage-dependent anion channel n=1 Tax=Caldanaerovirga acetigignens TaxID=447595 RepID=A0A1M7I5B3_9FIRM|nr:hypothetical protein [Caldanaerovirga acetigignens]SHM35972.1 Voltage-dependent anion channel [Caldanaerovirga acetigignens]
MDRIVKSVPIPISGLMLGVAAAGNLLSQYGSVYKNIFGFLSAVILVLVVAKIIMVPKSVLESFENLAVAGVMPTFSMGIIILANYIKDYLYEAAYLLWFSGLCLHLIVMYFFTKKYILNFKIEKVFPSYFVVYVGIVCGKRNFPNVWLCQPWTVLVLVRIYCLLDFASVDIV